MDAACRRNWWKKIPRKRRSRQQQAFSKPQIPTSLISAAEMEAKAEQSTAVSGTTGEEMPTANSPPRLETLIPCSKTGTVNNTRTTGLRTGNEKSHMQGRREGVQTSPIITIQNSTKPHARITDPEARDAPYTFSRRMLATGCTHIWQP
jgi:hypothetical protein